MSAMNVLESKEPGQLRVVAIEEVEQFGGTRSPGVLYRCTSEVAAELEFVFQHSTAKSKQKLLDAIILPQLQAMAKAIRGNN